MKIGIISNLYPPFIRGGAELIAALEAKGLKDAWQHVFVISSKPYRGLSSLTPSQNEEDGILVYRFFPLNIFYYLNDFKYPSFIRLLWHIFDTFNIFSYYQIKNILLKEKPDAIITHNLMGLGFLIPRLLKKLNIRHLHTLHDLQLATPSGLILFKQEHSFQHNFFKVIGYIKLMRVLFASPEVVISPSKFLLSYYQKLKFFNKSKKIVLPNPIKSIKTLKKKASYNLELLFLGQVHSAKGILELIKSFRDLPLPGVRLNIIGVGPDLNTAKKLAGADPRIRFFGWLAHHEMLPILSRMDVLLVPSLCYENSPTVIYELLALGVPVLAADIGGVAELIREGKNGWTYPAGDFKVLNQKILSIYQQKEKLAHLVANCQASVADYTLDKYIAKILALLNNEN